jgi:hypothetical protein
MAVAGTPFTCFTSAKVQILTPEQGVVRHLSVRIGTYMGSYVSSWQELVSDIPGT